MGSLMPGDVERMAEQLEKRERYVIEMPRAHEVRGGYRFRTSNGSSMGHVRDGHRRKGRHDDRTVFDNQPDNEKLATSQGLYEYRDVGLRHRGRPNASVPAKYHDSDEEG